MWRMTVYNEVPSLHFAICTNLPGSWLEMLLHIFPAKFNVHISTFPDSKCTFLPEGASIRIFRVTWFSMNISRPYNKWRYHLTCGVDCFKDEYKFPVSVWSGCWFCTSSNNHFGLYCLSTHSDSFFITIPNIGLRNLQSAYQVGQLL